VRMEMMKLVVAPHAVAALAVMTETGLLLPVLGGIPDLAACANMAKVEAAIGAPPDPVQRLGALAVRITEDAERMWQRLRLANAERDRLLAMGDRWWRVAPGDRRAARALLYRLGPQHFIDRVLLAWARSPQGAADESWRELASLPQRWVAPVFPLKSADFIKRGVPRGPALGVAMRTAEEAWIAADFPSEAGALAAIVDTALAAALRR